MVRISKIAKVKEKVKQNCKKVLTYTHQSAEKYHQGSAGKNPQDQWTCVQFPKLITVIKHDICCVFAEKP